MEGISDKKELGEINKKMQREKYQVMKGLNRKNERASPKMILKARQSLNLDEESKT